MTVFARLYAALAFAALAVPTLQAGSASAQVTRTFGDTNVICSEVLYCVAAMSSRDVDGAVSSVLQIARSPEPRSRWTIAVSTMAALAARDRPVSIAVDGKVAITLRPDADYAPFVNPGDFYILSQYALDRLMVDLRVGSEARFTYLDIAGNPHMERFSLDGLTAALASIDTIQGRVAGDRRAGPPVNLPPAPEIDPQAMVAMQGVPPRLVEWHVASSTCEAPDSLQFADTPPIIGALSSTAMLYAIPCYIRADRPNYRLYLIETGEIGGMHTLHFAQWSPRFGWTGTDTLETVSYDSEARRLSAVSLIGDDGCGGAGTWTWDDFAFRMERYAAPADCASPGDPTTWRQVFPAD